MQAFSETHIQELYAHSQYLKDRTSIFKYMTSTDIIWDWAWNLDPILKPQRILEIGCGLGSFWQHNAHKLPPSCDIVLTDISPVMLAECKAVTHELLSAHHNVNFLTADIQQLPFADESFDLVLCHFVLYYASDIPKALSEIKRVAKRAGKVSIFTLHHNFVKELYEFAHTVNARFPQCDAILNRFNEKSADQFLAQFFSSCEKHIYEREIKLVPGINVSSFFQSMAQSYQVPISGDETVAYQQVIDTYLAEFQTLACGVRAILYLGDT